MKIITLSKKNPNIYHMFHIFSLYHYIASTHTHTHTRTYTSARTQIILKKQQHTIPVATLSNDFEINSLTKSNLITLLYISMFQ